MADSSAPTAGFRERQVMVFARWLGLGAAGAALLPALLAWQAAPPGGLYVGAQTAVDDHMVYAAWMRQAMEGRFFFENRFTTDPQPGLTVHLYFWALGQVAHLTGIAAASNLARAAFGFLAVILLARFVLRLGAPIFPSKLAVGLGVFGGGAGFLAWQTFGVAFHPGSGSPIAMLTAGRLPADVWQTEGYFFPSLLGNGLFMASLCLMLVTLIGVLDARESWRPVLPGAAAFGLLMNIHSYDVLLLTLVLVGLAVAQAAVGAFDRGWALRTAAIGAGALPGALWFLHVLRSDPVFQARAATETFSPPLIGLLAGLLPLIVLAFAAFGEGSRRSRRRVVGAGALALALAAAALASRSAGAGYWVGPAGWIALYVGALALVALLARRDAAWNLLVSWAVIGLVAPWFPALFQRKLTMAIAVPWAILAALGLAVLLARPTRERMARNLAAALAIVLVSATSLRWFFREFEFIRQNVANTTVHPIFLPRDAVAALGRLSELPGRKVAVALPGIALPTESPDRFASPYVPDLNPFLAGWAGAVAPAGHWSETPDYVRRRGMATQVFLMATPAERRRELLEELGARYVLAPVPAAFPDLPLADLTAEGEVLVGGDQFVLIDRGG